MQFVNLTAAFAVIHRYPRRLLFYLCSTFLFDTLEKLKVFPCWVKYIT